MNQWFTYSVSSSSCRFAEMFTFSAKERDSETDFSYFGSRYYSSDLSIWLSVDPMSDKYPSLSSYVYCADNPVKLMDPEGETFVVADNDDSHNDLLSIVKPNNMDRISFGKDGKITVDMSGLKTEDAGLSLINDMACSEKNYYFETSDIALCRNENGNRTYVDLTFENTLGCINASTGGLDSRGKHTELPIEGFDGQVVISKSGSFSYGPQDRRRNVVYHELAENYLRTDKGMNYFGNNCGTNDGAHRTAAKMEFNAWGTIMPGSANYTSKRTHIGPMSPEYPRIQKYYINGQY